MTEQREMEQFETRFAGRARAYTNPATERRIDALAISRTAMSSRRATGWSQRRLGAALLGRRIAGDRWAVAVMAVVLVGVVGVAVVGRPSDSAIGPQPTPAASATSPAAGGPIPDVISHSWERPTAVTPGLDAWGSGSLRVTSGILEVGPEPGDAASRSEITATGPDTLLVAATVETPGCAIGDIGTYRWSVEGKGTVLTLTAIGADACAAREKALAGQWVRSDLPHPGEATLPPGTYLTSGFDPFDKPGMSGQLSYTVPEGWKVKDDQPATFELHHLADASSGQRSTDSFIFLFARPRMAADFQKGATCGPLSEAPGVGHGVDDIVAAIMARPGVVSTPPAKVSIGGFEGQMLDLRLAPSWTGGCQAPEGPVVSIPILFEAGFEAGPVAAIGPETPTRLILLDLLDGRTMSIGIFCLDSSGPSSFDDQVAAVMPVIRGFEFHPPSP